MRLSVRLAIFALVAICLPARVFAQANPCDTAAPTSGTAVTGQALTLTVCQSLKDANGNPATPTGFAVYDNGTRTTPTFTAGAPSTVSGLTPYSTSITAAATASVHTYQVAAVNAQGESAKSTPFVLTVNLPATVMVAPQWPSLK